MAAAEEEEKERENGRRNEGSGREDSLVERGRRKLRVGEFKRGLKMEKEGVPAIFRVCKVAPPRYCGNTIVGLF